MERGGNIVKEKAFEFAVRMVNAYKFLNKEQKEFVLSKQMLRSGTAIGALICESEYAQSKPDFISKLSIALKEANETEYWIRLLKESGYITVQSFESVVADCKELIKLLISIINSTKKSISKNSNNC
ncbi:MAG: four helix bundle protein [Dysgonamonadaceae bacterium]|jgi:four helix bundle protein|nr:four helix bundle protein [Dysgonamonadaceae bacterium]